MVKNRDLRPPVSYQGGKQRLSREIVDIMLSDNFINKDTKFYDLCSGSGAISLELVNRGIDSKNITMVDIGVYGYFWQLVSSSKFNFDKFKCEVKRIPKNKDKIKKHMEKLMTLPVNNVEDMVYKYLILQAGSFGGKQISINYNTMEWNTASFRNYWKPTPTSSRRSPVNPMQPMTDTIVKRIKDIIDADLKFNVLNADIYDVLDIIEYPSANCIFYLDPPYKNTSGYKDTFDWDDFISHLFDNTVSPIYVSEGYKDSDNAVLLNMNNKKGGISGNKKAGKKQEWLNIYK